MYRTFLLSVVLAEAIGISFGCPGLPLDSFGTGLPYRRGAVSGATGRLKSDDGSALVLNVSDVMLSYRPFLGVGYDVLGFDFVQGSQPLVLSTFKKRWADANASWARMVNPTAFWTYNTSRFIDDYASLFRDTTNTTLFWTQWAQGQWLPTGSLPHPDNATAVSSWAAERAKFVHSLVVDGGVNNLRYYCFSNEEEDVPKGNTANFITCVHSTQRLTLDGNRTIPPIPHRSEVKLVGTDFYPCKNSLNGIRHEPSIDSMDCHHYGPEGYDDFKRILAPPLAIAHDAKKNFFLSEFGGPSCGGKLAKDCHPGPSGAPAGCKDSCAWFDTSNEKRLGLILAQKVLATLNSGGQATGYWTFEDPLGGCPYWGLCRWNITGDQPATIGQLRCRSAHYSHGLLSKFLRGPAHVYDVYVGNRNDGMGAPEDGGDGNSIVTTFVRAFDGTSTLVILNTAETVLSSLRVQLPSEWCHTRSRFYRYTIAEESPPHNPAGDLPAPVNANLQASDSGVLEDTNPLPARSINIYTSAPAGAKFSVDSSANGDIGARLQTVGQPPSSCQYDPVKGMLQWTTDGNIGDANLYYRVLRGGQPLWSTMENSLHIDPEDLLEPGRTEPSKAYQNFPGKQSVAVGASTHRQFQVVGVQGVDRFGIASVTLECDVLASQQ